MTASMESGPVVLFLLANLRGIRSTSLTSGISLSLVPRPGNFVAGFGVINSPPLFELELELELVLVVEVVAAAPNPEAC